MLRVKKLSHEEIPRRAADAVRAGEKHPVTLLLNNIRSMWNVGALFRTADAALIEKLILTGYTAVPPRKEIEKTALGSTESVVWEYISNPLDAIESLKEKGVTVAALELCAGSRRYDSVQPQEFPLCLVVGNEVSGVDDDVLARCDFALEIPQYGFKQSMNVAVSAGIALFELIKACRGEK